MQQKVSHQSIDYISFAKGYAMATIVIFHFFSENIVFGNILDKAVIFGGAGVHLYFFLSGFGLCLSKKTTPIDFYQRRFSKILFPYYAFVSFAFLLSFFYNFSPIHSWLAYFSHIFLFKMFDNSLNGSFGYQLWFISTLVQFYLVFPLLLWLKEKVGNRGFLIGSILISLGYASFLYAFGLSDDNRVWDSFFLQYLWEFALGMVLAHEYKERGFQFWNKPLFWYAILAIAGVGLMGGFSLKLGEIGHAFNDIPSFCGYIGLSILVSRIADQLLPWLKKAFIIVGDLSYFLYLTHLLVISVLMDALHLFGKNVTPIYLVVFLPLAFFFAQLFKYIYTTMEGQIRQKVSSIPA